MLILKGWNVECLLLIGTMSFHHRNTDYGALIRNLSQQQYTFLPNTIGKRNYYLRNKVWKTKSLKTCGLAEACDTHTWQYSFSIGESPGKSILGSVISQREAHIAQCVLQSLETNDTCIAQVLVALYSKSPTLEPL